MKVSSQIAVPHWFGKLSKFQKIAQKQKAVPTANKPMETTQPRARQLTKYPLPVKLRAEGVYVLGRFGLQHLKVITICDPPYEKGAYLDSVSRQFCLKRV